MSLVFNNPVFLWSLPCAALPVVFHLFFRFRKQVRVFPTLMFFDRIDPRLSSRRKIREWLILLLRCLAIALILLALSRPIWLGVGRGNAAMVLMVDNSGSMSGPAPDGRSKLSHALHAAHALLSTLDQRDSAAVTLLVDDPLVPLATELKSERPAAAGQATLDRITETEATGSPARALERAFVMLTKSAAVRREIHIFTDLQEAEWKPSLVDFDAAIPRLTIVVHRIPSAGDDLPNIGLGEIVLPRKSIPVGRAWEASIELSNPTAADVSVQLNGADDSGRQHAIPVVVGARSVHKARLPLRFETPGFHWAYVWIEGDAFQADNKAGIGIWCAEVEKVLFAGRPGDFGALPAALAPGGNAQLSGIESVFVESGDSEEIVRQKPRVVVAAWETVSANAPGHLALKSFVEAGGRLILVPSAKHLTPRVEPPDWVGAALASVETQPEGFQTLFMEKGDAIWEDLRDEKGEIHLRNVRVFKCRPLRLSTGHLACFALEDGRPLLAQREIGKGKLIVSGLAFDPGWCNLPLKAGFLALAQNMALSGPSASSPVRAGIAGERAFASSRPSSPPVAERLECKVRSLAGSALDWKGAADDLPAFVRAGIYAIEANGHAEFAAIRASEKEGHFQFITGAQVPCLSRFEHSVQDYRGTEEFLNFNRQLRAGANLLMPLLVLAVLTLAGETWLANREQVAVARGTRREAENIAGISTNLTSS